MKLILIIFLVSIKFSIGQTFNRTYNLYADISNSVIEDSGYFIQSFNGFSNFYYDPLVVQRLNSTGDIIWQKIYGMNGADYFNDYSVLKIDQGYMIGAQYRDSLFNYYCSLMKLDTSGDSLWFYKYRPSTVFNNISKFVFATSDKGFIIAGEVVDTGYVNGDCFLLKVDSNGLMQWDSSYGGALYDSFYSAIELPDKGFLALGWTRSFGASGPNNRDFYLVRTDSIGHKFWQKTYGNSDFESAYGITSTLDGSYLLSGGKQVNGLIYQPWLIKIDINGTVIWQHTYLFNSDGEIWWARELPNRDIICAGSSRDSITLLDRGSIFCVDSTGTLKWHREFPYGNNGTLFRDVRPTSDGGFICTGTVFTGPSGNQDAWLVKLDSMGCDSDGCAQYTAVQELSHEDSALRIYPNPASDLITLSMRNTNADFFIVDIYNSQGQLVLHKKQLNTYRSFPVFINYFSSGIYFIRVQGGDIVYSGRFVKE